MEHDIMSRSITQKEFTDLIEHTLQYLTETDPSVSSHLFKMERQALPAPFFNSPLSHFCYVFKGVFLPSGSQDGIVWKPSQGAKPAGRSLLKRYFYYKKDNIKINRQVIWLSSNDNWCFLDYRYNFKGKIKLRDISVPEGFDFHGLLEAVYTFTAKTLRAVPKKRAKRSLMHAQDGEEEDEEEEDHPTMESSERLPSNSIQHIVSSLFPSSPPQVMVSPLRVEPLDTTVPLNDTLIIPFHEETEGLFTDEFHLVQNNFSNSMLDLSDVPVSPKDSTTSFEEETSFNSRKKARIERPTSPLSSLAPLTSWDWQWASPSNIFNSGLEYFFDMISHLICNQLMFQRRFFRRFRGGDDTLEKMRQVYVTFDLKEFPGRIIKSFFEYISENFFQTKSDELPTIYCLVCGHDIKDHDESKHREFFGQLDQTLVISFQEKARNVYELVKQYIIFLLKNPNSHEALKQFLTENLHCPFCSGTGGIHNHAQHKPWIRLWLIDPPVIKGPAPSTNVYDYTKSTFEWLVDQVPFYIPPFLLSLHYAKYVRTFMECLVTIWNSVRLPLPGELNIYQR